jgi:hypothetical protein
MTLFGFVVLFGGQACDPRAAARRVFTDQGLHVLTPARTYIELGGIVVVPSSGAPYYVDRLDSLPSGATDKAVDFVAVLLKESLKQTTGLGSAVSALQSVIPVPLNVQFDRTQVVELAQVDASGSRLRIPTVQSLVQLPGTQKWISDELSRKARTFVIYEVYAAKSLSVKTENNNALKIGLQVGETTSSTNTPGSAKAPSPDEKSEKSKAPESSSGISGSWKRVSNYELALQSQRELPFAVRIAEVVRGKAGLELRPGSFKFKGGLASGTDVERYTALVDAAAPELSIERKPSR